MAPPIRIAVVGLGIMGARHARAVAAHAVATLTAAVDVDAARRTTFSAEFSCALYDDIAALTGQLDAAIVATPTATHGALAVTLLDAGIACLVEKPFVGTAREGADIVAAASRSNVVVQVGHIERFNPAVRALLACVPQTESIRTIATRRINAASARVTDIDVVMDLMVHDIDAVLALKRAPVTEVRAQGNADDAEAWITFGDGAVAHLTASRARPGRVRDLRLEAGGTTFALDYVARKVNAVDSAGNTAALPVPGDDALTAQLSAFISAVRGGKIVVPASDGLAVMDVAWRVQAALGLRRS